jgi:hypothetical protein
VFGARRVLRGTSAGRRQASGALVFPGVSRFGDACFLAGFAPRERRCFVRMAVFFGNSWRFDARNGGRSEVFLMCVFRGDFEI